LRNGLLKDTRLVVVKYGDLRCDEGKRTVGNDKNGKRERRRGELGRVESRVGRGRTEET
jgi:hypothetical protein